MKKVLMLGAGDAQIDAIEYCKDAGYTVIGCSYTTVDHGIKLLDHFENTDIKDCEAIRDVALKHGVDYIYSIGSDLAMPTAMRVSKSLNLPYFVEPECTEVCLRKDKIRNELGNDCEFNIPFCTYTTIEEALKHEHFPAMMKPVDSQGQRGCFRVDNIEDIKTNFETSLSFSSAGIVIIEEFIDGKELSANAYMADGKLVYCIVSDRISSEDYPGGIIERHRIPSEYVEGDQSVIEDIVKSIAQKFEIDNGPLYLQIKKTDQGEYKLLEAMPRLDGCHLWRLIKIHYGIDLLETTMKHLMEGLKPQAVKLDETHDTHHELCFINREPKSVYSTSSVDADDSKYIFHYYDDSDVVIEKNGYYEKCGYYIREAKDTEMKKKKLAIIGAALFQEPAILKAKDLGIETHVFAWEAGDPGEKMADFFYPISIREKEEILEKCEEIGIDGIISIASDLAMVTVNYVADKMGLTGNSLHATEISTNKFAMREAFEENGDPSPKFVQVDETTDRSIINGLGMEYPLIVKPTDRSGSRGVKIVEKEEDLAEAIEFALGESFEKKAIVEEYLLGDEYSVEYISCRGKHYLLAVTEKTTSGPPWFIEMSHIQPAPISDERKARIKAVSDHALDTLQLMDGAGHIELKVDENEIVKIVEIGGRMGGGFIGSDLVELSTGYDFVEAVIRVALGEEIEEPVIEEKQTAGIKFITCKKDLEDYRERKNTRPDTIIRESVDESVDLKDKPDNINDRKGYYIYRV